MHKYFTAVILELKASSVKERLINSLNNSGGKELRQKTEERIFFVCALKKNAGKAFFKLQKSAFPAFLENFHNPANYSRANAISSTRIPPVFGLELMSSKTMTNSFIDFQSSILRNFDKGMDTFCHLSVIPLKI